MIASIAFPLYLSHRELIQKPKMVLVMFAIKLPLYLSHRELIPEALIENLQRGHIFTFPIGN